MPGIRYIGIGWHLLYSQWLGIVGPSQQENLAIVAIVIAKEQLPSETEPEKGMRQTMLQGGETDLV